MGIEPTHWLQPICSWWCISQFIHILTIRLRLRRRGGGLLFMMSGVNLEGNLGEETTGSKPKEERVKDEPEDPEVSGSIEKPLTALVAHYLAREKRGTRPLDPVARFHLGNGARIERINWLANNSAGGLAQSAGLMVNYAYRLEAVEKNHEGFAESGEIALSSETKRLLK